MRAGGLLPPHAGAPPTFPRRSSGGVDHVWAAASPPAPTRAPDRAANQSDSRLLALNGALVRRIHFILLLYFAQYFAGLFFWRVRVPARAGGFFLDLRFWEKTRLTFTAFFLSKSSLDSSTGLFHSSRFAGFLAKFMRVSAISQQLIYFQLFYWNSRHFDFGDDKGR